MTLVDRIWEQTREVAFLTKEDFLRGLEGWEVRGHEVAGETVGAVLTKGPEFHFVTFGGRWQLTRADIRHYLVPLIDQHGCVTTRTPKDDSRQQRFNRLLGFVDNGEDEFFTYFKLTRLRHV